jgi:hypothetical protein
MQNVKVQGRKSERTKLLPDQSELIRKVLGPDHGYSRTSRRKVLG